VVPAIVNNFIGAFKDTSLVTIVSLYDLTGAMQLALGDADWRQVLPRGLPVHHRGRDLLRGCFSMSRYSLWLEGHLNTGIRRTSLTSGSRKPIIESSASTRSTSGTATSTCCATSTSGGQGRAHRDLRPLGLGQEHADPLHQPAGGAPGGQLVVDGIELSDDVKAIEAIRKQVGMVFQQFNLFPHLTVLENLTLAPMWVGKVPKKEPRSAR
jgi:hypothetical protein